MPTKYKGYCTGVWFDEAIKYIEDKEDEPFFCYIYTNAPQLPYNVPESYYNEYKDLKITDNTIVFFMTDNGTASGYKKIAGKQYGFNAGMKGTKNSEYEGGHRVPFFISYPDKNIKGGKDVTDLTAHLDILPTLVTLCDLELPEGKSRIDGSDISSLLLGDKVTIGRWPFESGLAINDTVKGRAKTISTEAVSEGRDI